MSQSDFNLANQGFPSMRVDMNTALQALASNSAGDTPPSTTYAYQWWYDSDNDILKFRNDANDAWIDFAEYDTSANKFSSSSFGGGLYKGENGDVGAATGAGDIFRINEQELNTNVTIDADENASATGPLAVASGVTLTVTTGGNLSIV